MRTYVNGDLWTIEVVTGKQMKKHREDGEHLAGLCVPFERTIYIANDCITYATVAHELYHAFWSYLYLDDTSEVKVQDVEEIAAAMFADKGVEIVKKAKMITKKLEKGN